MSLGRSASMTDAGRKRRRNEDALVCEPPLFAVADGMGGAQAGELASRLAAAALVEQAAGLEAAGERRVAELIREANRRVYERQSEDRAASGMGTTMTVALVEEGLVRIGHVGDSRAYLVREGRLEQLTQDHSLVAELVRTGKLTPEEAETHPQRAVITRALGTEPDVDVDTFSVEARPGDLFLLCSDGLTSMVDDEAILGIVEESRADLQAAARALVRAANRKGGEDNITVVCFEIAEGAGDPKDTAAYPAVEPAEPAPDDEATLSGAEGVPLLEDLLPPAEHRADEWLVRPEEAAAEPPPARRLALRLPQRRLTWWIAGLASAVIAVGLAVWGLSESHFVGAEPDGHVAVYQGVPWDIAGSVRLYRAVYVSPLLAAQLAQEERRGLFDHELQGYSPALAEVKSFEQEVVP